MSSSCGTGSLNSSMDGQEGMVNIRINSACPKCEDLLGEGDLMTFGDGMLWHPYCYPHRAGMKATWIASLQQ